MWCAGLPPLGYDLKDKLLVVKEDEATLVRRIFDLYLNEQSADMDEPSQDPASTTIRQ